VAKDSQIFCPVCGSEMLPIKRIETKLKHIRFRRFECSSLACDHQESIFCGGHSVARNQEVRKEIRIIEKRSRGKDIY